MTRLRTRNSALTALVLATAVAGTAHAHDPITWRSLDCGGAAFVTAGGYRLGGTIGQPDAGRLAGGGFILRGGFWLGGQALVDVDGDVPQAIVFRFFRTTPHPVRSQSRVAFALPSAARVRFSIFDVTGRAVQRLDFGRLPAGHHERGWSAVDDGGRPLPGGVYFLRLEADREQASQKVLIYR